MHQVKGDEAEAALVCLPKVNKRKASIGKDKAKALMEEWLQANDMDSEAIRVLYVAATRARRLLAIAVPIEFKNQAADYLKSSGVAVAER
jgi:DNA helicase II / ATP-dependent DNA helicase PcrA